MSTQTSPTPQPPATPRASSPEALDEIIETTKSHGWWALWAISTAVVVALIWSFVAKIPIQAKATGVIPSLYYSTAITSPAEGKLSINIQSNRNVSKGDTLAIVQPYDGSPAITINAPETGQVSEIYEGQGESLEIGTNIAQLVSPPNLAKGVQVVTFLPASSALKFSEGKIAKVTVTNVATSESTVVDATIILIANTPSSLASMETISGDASTSQQWLDQSDGSPYLVALIIKNWPTDKKSLSPAAGQIVQITNTYGSIHPIEMLFRGK